MNVQYKFTKKLYIDKSRDLSQVSETISLFVKIVLFHKLVKIKNCIDCSRFHLGF